MSTHEYNEMSIIYDVEQLFRSHIVFKVNAIWNLHPNTTQVKYYQPDNGHSLALDFFKLGMKYSARQFPI